VEVLWRPGCPYCGRLRRGLARAGVRTVERDIWSDPDAAARVRAATGGAETVPTVLVGARALVNPTARQVVATVRSEFGDDADAVIGEPAAAPPWWRDPAGWTAAAAVLWVVLAVWQPGTNWHLAPILLAIAAPWVTGQDLRAGDRRAGGRRLIGSATAGLVAASVVTVGLSRAGLLRGPTVLELSDPTVEAVVLAVTAAALAVAIGWRRVVRAAVTRAAGRGHGRGERLLPRGSPRDPGAGRDPAALPGLGG
jgi:glutaredoxin